MLQSCAPAAGPGAPPVQQPAPQSAEPEIRVALAVGASGTRVGSPGGLVIADPAGTRLAVVSPGETRSLIAAGTGVSINGGTSTPAEALGIAAADPGQPVWVNGRGYRGVVEVIRDQTGLTLVNRVPLESYLQGVVSAEMGRRAPSDQEALRAQAVVSRTYALRNLRRWAAQGFDLYGTVADQVYGGITAETPEGVDAVTATRGEVLTFQGAPIDAFFYSTCGGRTADGVEVFRGADRPYLRTVEDVADDGIAYCSISPRFRWREEWSGDVLRQTLQRTLPAAAGIAPGAVRQVSDVRVSYRTRSGRVGRLTVGLGNAEAQVDGPAVRQVLRPPSGELLRSATFELTVTASGGQVTRLVADGAGAGHGVGFCQWGAVGRSRAGQTFARILAAYYPGTTLERLY
jgi:stage II sporulation protein D